MTALGAILGGVVGGGLGVLAGNLAKDGWGSARIWLYSIPCGMLLGAAIGATIFS